MIISLHTFLFIAVTTLSIFLSSLYGYPNTDIINSLCFIFIITIGASHGAFDKSKGKKIFILCQKGISSKKAAELLLREKIESFSIEGGIESLARDDYFKIGIF